MSLPAWSEAFTSDRLTRIPQTLPQVITREWAMEGADGGSVRVAVVDSGVEPLRELLS